MYLSVSTTRAYSFVFGVVFIVVPIFPSDILGAALRIICMFGRPSENAAAGNARLSPIRLTFVVRHPNPRLSECSTAPSSIRLLYTTRGSPLTRDGSFLKWRVSTPGPGTVAGASPLARSRETSTAEHPAKRQRHNDESTCCCAVSGSCAIDCVLPPAWASLGGGFHGQVSKPPSSPPSAGCCVRPF